MQQSQNNGPQKALGPQWLGSNMDFLALLPPQGLFEQMRGVGWYPASFMHPYDDAEGKPGLAPPDLGNPFVL